jgi:hypothetical protein
MQNHHHHHPLNHHRKTTRVVQTAHSSICDLNCISSNQRPATIADPFDLCKHKHALKNDLKQMFESSIDNKSSIHTAGVFKIPSLKINNNVINTGVYDTTSNSQTVRRNSQYFSNMIIQNTQHLKDLFKENAIKMKNTINDLTNSHISTTKLPHCNRQIEQDENSIYNNRFIQELPMSNISLPKSHFRSSPKILSTHSNFYIDNNIPDTQNVMFDAFSSRAVNPTNIRFVTTEAREIRDKQITHALNIISQSMEPPSHNADKYREWLLNELKPEEEVSGSFNAKAYKIVNFMMGTPFTVLRALWHYIILEIHLAYNLTLLYFTAITTPPLYFFVIGLILFWFKVIYELYRDIMHRDDPLYASNVAKEMSIAAAISASMGFVLNIKAQSGAITTAWWKGN